MHQDSWLQPNLADGCSAWASDAAPTARTISTPPTTQPVPRSRVALSAATSHPPATHGSSHGMARVGRAIPLGGVNPDVWGDAAGAARLCVTASVMRAAAAANRAPAVASLPTVRSDPSVTKHVTKPVTKPASERPHSAGPRARPRLIEFIGHGALSVTSSITGKHYRFTEHGTQLIVDPRDWSQLSRVPSLRAIVS